MILRAFTLAAAGFSLALTAPSAIAQDRGSLRTVTPKVMVPVIQAQNTARMTTFDPKRHGFKFANRFRNNFVSELDIRTGGLCGGMVYSALDYWRAGKPVPQQTYLPTEGAVLQSYIYRRQVNSIVSNADRWTELALNPGGARNNEFWRWGMEGKRGGQLDVLRRNIEAGRPVPLGLLGCKEGCFGDHQVLAIGYDPGRYSGDLGRFQTDLRIFVYDPNSPSARRVLRTNPTTRKFYFEDDPEINWRTYFVDPNWQAVSPPTIEALERELLMTFETGEDDLRSRLRVHLERNNGRDILLLNVNKSKRWITNSTQTVGISLPSGVSYDNLTGIKIRRWSSDLNDLQRAGTDNWDLRRLLIQSGDVDGKKMLFTRAGTPLHRFTADQSSVRYQFGSSANELVVTFTTGNDDLRGGNDNVDLLITRSNGPNLRFRNVNQSRKWERGAVITRYLALPPGTTHRDLVSARITTRFGGGMGGDNWDLFGLTVATREGGTNHRVLFERGVNGEPIFRFKGEDGKRAKSWNF
ncbi:MAG: hypothetical protein ABJ239_12485 [Erythrobacter sp.]